MARMMTGVGRVTVFRLLHTWPDTFGAVAYTTSDFGQTALIGYLPVPEVPDVRLMDVAASHAPQATDWALCTGWSSRVVPKPGTLDLRDAPWALEVDGSTEPAKPIYGHTKLHVGRLSLAHPDHPEDPSKREEYTLALAREVVGSRAPVLVS